MIASFNKPDTSVTERRVAAFSPLRAAILTGAALLTILLVRTAWVAEDAYISFRVLDNLLHGYGLRWNLADRVQTYTDPLFLGIVTLATWVSGNVYLSAIAVSLALTLAAFFLIMRHTSEVGVLTAATALCFSKAFVDFSVSGLENPATHLAMAAYLYFYWRNRDPLWLSLTAALAVTNRMDTMLFFLPSLAWVYVRAGWRVWKPALLGWLPFIAWSLFSLFYYGFLFPNTAYAKLHTGIPRRDMIFQGLTYYINALRWDTATLFVILLGLIVAYMAREWLLGIGMLLNLVYIVQVGGDFMSSRFFSASLFLSAALVARYWRPAPILAGATVLLIAGMGMSVPSPTVTSATGGFGSPWPVDTAGIADERAYYYQGTGLLHYHRDSLWPAFPTTVWGNEVKAKKQKFVTFGNIGIYGYFAGPNTHIVDPLALGDALLARLPIAPGGWRVGHFRRAIPEGYPQTLKTGVNQIADPALHAYYDHLHTVISGDLFSWNRFKDIFLFNIGYYEGLLPRAKPGK